MKTLKTVLVGSNRRIPLTEFNRYLNTIGAEPYSNDNTSGFLTVREAADWLNVSMGYIYKLIYAYEKEPIQIGMADVSD